MNQELGLKILGQIMAWNDDRAREEFRWLREGRLASGLFDRDRGGRLR